MSSPSPASRTMAALRKAGWTVQAVEHFNVFAGVRQDLFGVIDLLAMRGGEPLLAVQATSAGNLAARQRKALAGPHLRTWLGTGCRFQLWAWGLKGPRGGRKTWQVTVRELTPADLPPPQ